MLRSVIDDYLTSTKELQLLLPFIQLLELSGFYDIHLIHGTTEFGKDIIAKKGFDKAITQYSFQLKAGDISLSKFELKFSLSLLRHVQINCRIQILTLACPIKLYLLRRASVTPATLAFQEFNKYVVETLRSDPIETWEKQKLTSDFLSIGIGPFFELHRSPGLTGRFFGFYTQIVNDEPIDSFSIEAYTKHWLELDWHNLLDRLQIFFEAYLFSKILLDRGRPYEATLVLSALIRALLRNHTYDNYRQVIEKYFG